MLFSATSLFGHPKASPLPWGEWDRGSVPAGSLLCPSLGGSPDRGDVNPCWTASRTADLPSKQAISCQLAVGKTKQARLHTAPGFSTAPRSSAALPPTSPQPSPPFLCSPAKPELPNAAGACSLPVLWAPSLPSRRKPPNSIPAPAPPRPSPAQQPAEAPQHRHGPPRPRGSSSK